MAIKSSITILFLSLSLWLGSACYFSFFAANELFQGFSQDIAAKAVGLLFPTFFTLCSIFALLTCILYFVVTRRVERTGRGKWFTVGAYALILASLFTWINRFILLPKVESLEIAMGPISKASTTLVKQFYMYHGISMMLDLLAIIGTVLVWSSLAFGMKISFTAQRSV